MSISFRLRERGVGRVVRLLRGYTHMSEETRWPPAMWRCASIAVSCALAVCCVSGCASPRGGALSSYMEEWEEAEVEAWDEE